MAWQDECRARGGMVTVLPNTVTKDYIPVCRLTNNDGTSNYIDMRSWYETLTQNAIIDEENWQILLGNAVVIRDNVVTAAVSVFKWTFTTIAIAGAIGLAIFKSIEKK